MEKPAILLIEDDPSGLEVATYNLKKAGYEVTGVSNGARGLELFSPERHNLVITDIKMPGLSGLQVLERVKEQAPHIPVLVITAYGKVETAVEAMKLGAQDFIGKPFNRDHFLIAVEKALESSRLKQEVQTLRIKARGVERPLIHHSREMKNLLAIADQVAPSEATVLITGESGTGKELIARRIHVLSGRAEQPFVVINCAAVPNELLESELFGHEKGSFTGALKKRAGKFRQADGGTIFLDEIAELPLALQAKLLRVLQERVVDVLGADRPVPVDVRVIAATNRVLPEQIREGTFREDLYYRLNVVEVPIPPLRERPGDIAPLVMHFVKVFGRGRELEVTEDLLEEMKTRPWPGNVRELENACERLVILCKGDRLSPLDLPQPTGRRMTNGPEPHQEECGETYDGDWPPLPEEGLSLLELERKVIERVLQLKEGNVSQAAAYLGLPRHILAYRMTKYGISK